MYERTTNGITVTVNPFYLNEHSVPDDNLFVWGYNVQIANDSKQTITLSRRHWKIIDANGAIQEVDGAGVVGETPKIAPGDHFSYTSGTPLPTPSGIMTGEYFMKNDNGDDFAVEIPAFSLDSPYQPIHLQ